MKILVTGASGFIGRALCLDLQASGFSVRAVMRQASSGVGEYECCYGALDDETFLLKMLEGIDVVIHLAGRAHQFGQASNNLEAMLDVNKRLTLELASCAAKAGVKRFVFISSIGVNGVETGSTPVDEFSEVNPVKDYAISKYQAELGLSERYTTIESSMELVIVRPPLVYAGNAPGNFQRLLKLVELGVPLPFSGVNNKRSMISLNNLTDFLKTCAVHPNARGQLFLVSDGDDLSLPEIIRGLASGMGRKPRLFYFPVSVMFTLSKILGKSALMTQLCGSFVLNSTKARASLDWTPPFSSCQELVKAAHDYKMSSEVRSLKSAQSE